MLYLSLNPFRIFECFVYFSKEAKIILAEWLLLQVNSYVLKLLKFYLRNLFCSAQSIVCPCIRKCRGLRRSLWNCFHHLLLMQKDVMVVVWVLFTLFFPFTLVYLSHHAWFMIWHPHIHIYQNTKPEVITYLQLSQPSSVTH